MDWINVLTAIVSIIGTGGIGGLIVTLVKGAKEHELAKRTNQAEIQKLQAETNLQVERVKFDLINELQEERERSKKDVEELRLLVVKLTNRIHELETVLIQNNIPVPEWHQ